MPIEELMQENIPVDTGEGERGSEEVVSEEQPISTRPEETTTEKPEGETERVVAHPQLDEATQARLRRLEAYEQSEAARTALEREQEQKRQKEEQYLSDRAELLELARFEGQLAQQVHEGKKSVEVAKVELEERRMALMENRAERRVASRVAEAREQRAAAQAQFEGRVQEFVTSEATKQFRSKEEIALAFMLEDQGMPRGQILEELALRKEAISAREKAKKRKAESWAATTGYIEGVDGPGANFGTDIMEQLDSINKSFWG